MNGKKYAIGVDFGTQSGRTLLVEVDSGREIACAVVPYADGVIDTRLPDSDICLDVDWALQNPDDYLAVLHRGIPSILKEAAVDAQSVVGLGIDFTSCTMLPVSKDGRALCQTGQYRNNPHAWVKLWKHHAAQDEANRLNEIAADRKEAFLNYYGGRISSEWLIPKIWQILNEAPEIYDAADRFMEAADWITMQVTGVDVRNSCAAGYKGTWRKQGGYPSKDFLRALDPRLENLVEDKLNALLLPVGSKAGEVTAAMAAQIGLNPGTAVAVGNVDAHVAVPAAGVVEPGKMVMIMGTSTCHMVISKQEKVVSGMSGVVEDGIIPGFYGYEAGQAAVGDIFDWFVECCVPGSYKTEAKAGNLNIHQLLEKKATELLPGESGLLALDWWNGNRTPLVDADLSGMLLGITLHTKPEEIYRALIEATAFGTNMIIETFCGAGVEIDQLVACGGLPEKNRMLMQIYSDVTGREIHVAASPQTPALGAAMFGAVAAGKDRGGYDSIFEAARNMARTKEIYRPVPENVIRYKVLYEEYKTLHNYFGTSVNNVMKQLKAMKRDAMG
jgi:L-ribulokinase